MGAVLTNGGLFPPELVKEVISFVSGHSSLAKMSGAVPVSFTGNNIFTFDLDSEVDLVAENGAKSNGGATADTVTIQPVKIEYGFRTSDEFRFASEEYQIDVLRAFADGFAKKVARGLDIMAMHGVNPRTGSAATQLATNNFVDVVTNSVTYVPATPTPVADINSAVALIDAAGIETTGLIMGSTFRSDLAAVTQGTASNMPMFPELMFGQTPASLYGLACDSNGTVEFGSADLRALVGNFRDYFRWGYAKNIPIQIIEYGDPDNSGNDLKGYNQIYIRGEMYLGWGILNPAAFAQITE